MLIHRRAYNKSEAIGTLGGAACHSKSKEGSETEVHSVLVEREGDVVKGIRELRFGRSGHLQRST